MIRFTHERIRRAPMSMSIPRRRDAEARDTFGGREVLREQRRRHGPRSLACDDCELPDGPIVGKRDRQAVAQQTIVARLGRRRCPFDIGPVALSKCEGDI